MLTCICINSITSGVFTNAAVGDSHFSGRRDAATGTGIPVTCGIGSDGAVFQDKFTGVANSCPISCKASHPIAESTLSSGIIGNCAIGCVCLSGIKYSPSISTAGTIETAFLERGLIWIASVTTIAPLIGFLGTVSGMINAFEAIAAAEQVNAKLVASGISEALITTATGLMVAIPASIGYNYFVSAIDRFVIEMEETSAELVEELTKLSA